ncbi:MAG: adenine deaminase [Planctomycetota bacterium]|nr:adenine deaminase [Planctomycetota bacterium]
MRTAIPRTDPKLLAVARGDEPADLLIDNVRVVNVFTRRIQPGPVAIVGGRIAAIGFVGESRETIDAGNAFAVPGLIDAHMHVESTMLMPSEFARLAVARGTTAAVLDPHEIANVLGLDGVRMLMDDAEGSPIQPIWMASSCVPASHMETSGATLGIDETRELLDDPRVLGLAEMMNFPGVVHAMPEVLAKVALGLEHGLVDGHAPGLGGRHLQAYVAAGIMTDHECTTADEAREKLALGMQIAIREGSAARNLAALIPAITPETVHRFCFCTDDRHPGDLMDHGHIDHVVRRAIALGLDPLDAIMIATINTANHYRQPDLGAIAPGRIADLLLVDDLQTFVPRMVLSAGRVVARDGEFIAPPPPRPPHAPAAVKDAGCVVLPCSFDAESLRIPADPASTRVRVIGMDPHQLITESLVVEPKVHDGRIVADPERDICKLAVIERHGCGGGIGLGLIRGFQLARGALASTIGHDSHNLAVVGADDEDMALAARAVAEVGGGQAVAVDGKVLAVLPLPIAGLISPEPAVVVVAQQRALLAAARSLGCPIDDPFMPLSFMPLVVIPHLKLSDKGLVDVDRFELVSLQVP